MTFSNTDLSVLQTLAFDVSLTLYQLKKRNKNEQGAPEMTPLDELTALRQRVVGLETAEAQHKSVEEVLRKSAEEIKDFYDKAPCGYHSLDKNGVFVRINETELAWLGYTRNEIIGKKFPEIITPESRKTFQATFPILRQRGWVRDLELELVRKDGSVMPVLISASAILDEKGGFLMSRSTVYDMTERKQAEKALRESRELYWALFNGCPQGILMANIETHRFLYVNPAICRMLGYTEAELLQLGVADIHPAEVLRQIEAEFAKMVRGERTSIETIPCRRKDGTVLFVDITSARLQVTGREDVVVGFFADVTERKHIEEAREQSVSLLRATLESTADGILVVDHQGKIVGFNKRFAQLWRIPETIIVSRNDQQALAFATGQLKDPEAFLAKVNQLYTQPEAESFDMLEFKDGRLFERYSLPQRIEGRPVGRVWSFRDVTDRNRAEELLRVEKERLDRASVAGNVALWEWDMATGRLEWSNTADSMLGYEPGTFPRTLQTWEEIVHPDDRDLESRMLAKHLEENTPYSVEYRARRRDGSYIWWHDMGACRRDEQGKAYQMSGVCVDITERKRAEEALTNERALLRTLVDNLPSSVYLKDLAGRKTLVNRVELDYLGATSEAEVLGKTDFDFFPLEQAAVYHAIDQEIIRTGQPVINREGSLTKPDGSIIHLLGSVVPLRDATGRVTGLAGINYDITERKLAEEERHKLEAQMQQSQRLESLGILAGGIAHDFNNLLTVILGHANLALADLSPESPARENLLEIDNASHRAAELCRQMLAYSGRGSFVMKPINLSRLAQELIHMLQVSISKKAMLRCGFEENLPFIEADPAQVRQVVMNLVINASEAIGNKEGIISISTGSMQCDQTYLRGNSLIIKPPLPGKYVYIEISDTGCGMDPGTLAKIFDPFFTTKFTGRGLGLAAVLGIVQQHKGAIKVASEPGKGTTFRVLFPASSNTDTPPEAEMPPKLWRGSGTILVVDDEAEVLNVAKIMLEHHGFSVLAATDGREAIKLFQKHGRNIICVLLDMTMPHMDGEETYHELHRIHKDAQVIIASGYSEQEMTKRFAGHQLAGFIEKPYEAMALIAKLRDVLGKS
jgi:PAS domain S-box-containing protein